MEKNYQALKQELKQLASELRNDKDTLKKTQKGLISLNHPSSLQYMLLKKSKSCRYKHIAYSMMKGHTYEQIEPKCREDNKPDQKLIQGIIDEYSAQDVCAGSK